MPNVSDFNTSKYLKKEDCDPPLLLTIRDFRAANLAREGEPEKTQWVLQFQEDAADFPLGNLTNQNTLKEMAGTEDLSKMIGMKIVVYVNPDIEYRGKRTGGIRIRPPKGFVSPYYKASVSDINEDDSIPF